MFLNLNKRKNRRNIKKIYINWCTYKNINQDDKNHYIAFMNYKVYFTYGLNGLYGLRGLYGLYGL